MEPTSEAPLRHLADFAALHNIKGASAHRNSLLKPLDIILEELERSAHPEDPGETALMRAAVKTLIMNHIVRIARGTYKPGATKASQINAYVDLFFDGVLGQMHQGHINKVLDRAKLLRAAYLLWFREAWAAKKTGGNFDQAVEELGTEDEAANENAEA